MAKTPPTPIQARLLRALAPNPVGACPASGHVFGYRRAGRWFVVIDGADAPGGGHRYKAEAERHAVQARNNHALFALDQALAGNPPATPWLARFADQTIPPPIEIHEWKPAGQPAHLVLAAKVVGFGERRASMRARCATVTHHREPDGQLQMTMKANNGAECCVPVDH